MPTLLLFFSVLLTPALAHCKTAAFHAPIAPLLETLRQSAADTETPPAGPAADTHKPIVLAISGVHPGEIGRGLEFRHILSLWKWLFPGQEPDQKLIMGELEKLHIELAESAPEAYPEDHENYVESSMRGAIERHKLDIDLEGFDWSRDPGDTAISTARLVQTLKELHARAGGRPVHLVTHSWGTVLAHEALFKLENAGTPMPIERMITMGSPLVPVVLILRILGNLDRLRERLQSRVFRPDGIAHWVNLYSENDPFSGEIFAADENIRVDGRVDAYEALLLARLAAGAPRAKVNADLKALKSGLKWHLAYTGSFEAKLEVLQEDLSWPIREENLGAMLPPRIN